MLSFPYTEGAWKAALKIRTGHNLEEEGARWPHRSSKPDWRLILLPEGSTPSPLRQFSKRAVGYFFVFGAFPVPDSPTDCGELANSSTISSCPLCSDVSIGLKVTDTSQLLPGARVFAHSDFTAKDGDALSIVTLTEAPFFLSVFFILTFLALLVVPTITLSPNPIEAGLMLNFPMASENSPNTAS